MEIRWKGWREKYRCEKHDPFSKTEGTIRIDTQVIHDEGPEIKEVQILTD